MSDLRIDFVREAAALRARAQRLETVVSQINAAAEALEAEVAGSGKKVLRGRDLLTELLKYVDEGETLHYRELHGRLVAAGFNASGKVPVDTLLAQINRAPEFKNEGRRSGLYTRVAP